MRELFEKNIEKRITWSMREPSFKRGQSYHAQRTLNAYFASSLEEKYLCPNCGTPMQKSFPLTTIYFCPDCLSSIEETKWNLDSNNICPNCSQFLNLENECMRCGYSLGRDFD